MAPRYIESDSSDDEGAPESVPLTQSKRVVKQHEDSLKQIHTAEKQKKRLRNQERDRRLKEQAENSKRRRKDHDDDGLTARMERAMQEAAGELGADSDEDGSETSEEEFMGIDMESGNQSSSEYSGESSRDLDEEIDADEEPTTMPKANANYLPDHLFTTAFSSQSAKSVSKRKAKTDVPTGKARKRVRRHATPKDVLIGSRTVRTLAPTLPTAASTLPSAKVRKFLDRSLGLKNGGSKRRVWERRPVNLGVMKRDGPAASFVRNR